MSQKTNRVIEAYFLLPVAYQDAANAKFEHYGLGPDNFSVGLSASGSPPAQACHARIKIRVNELAKVKWVADNAPKAWLWLRVLTEYLSPGDVRVLTKIRDTFDLAPYQDVAWQTRSKAYVKIGTAEIRPEAAFAWLAAHADPSFSLQVISTL